MRGKRRWWGLKIDGNFVVVLSSFGEKLTLKDFENEFSLTLPDGKKKVVEIELKEKK